MEFNNLRTQTERANLPRRGRRVHSREGVVCHPDISGWLRTTGRQEPGFLPRARAQRLQRGRDHGFGFADLYVKSSGQFCGGTEGASNRGVALHQDLGRRGMRIIGQIPGDRGSMDLRYDPMVALHKARGI